MPFHCPRRVFEPVWKMLLYRQSNFEKRSTGPLVVRARLQELLAIQQNDGPKDIGFFGTRNMGVTHQKLVEILSYAYASAVRGWPAVQAVQGAGLFLSVCLQSDGQDFCQMVSRFVVAS